MALVPGTDMDAVDGGGFDLLPCAAPTEVLTEVVERIDAFQQRDA